MHAAGLVHGDIKPDNILVDRRGVSKLVDFGLAVPASVPGDTALAGSPAYLSPEQLRGAAPSVQTDIYSCAVLLFELLCGRRPYEAQTRDQLLQLHLTAPVPDPRTYVPDLGEDLAALCRAGLAKDPAQRPPSAAAFLAQLEDAARRRYGPTMLGAAGLGAALGGLVAGILATGPAVPGGTPAAPAPTRPPRVPHRFRAPGRTAAGGKTVGVVAATVLVVAGLVTAVVLARHHDQHPIAGHPASVPPSTTSRASTPPSGGTTSGHLVVTVPSGNPNIGNGYDVLDPDGTVVQSVPHPQGESFDVTPVLSPDGTHLALAGGSGRGQLTVTGAGGGAEHVIWSSTSRGASEPAWSPDGTRIAFCVDRDQQNFDIDIDIDIDVVDADGSGLRTVVPSALHLECSQKTRSIAWSPDGTRLAYTGAQGEVRTVDVTGTHDTVIAQPYHGTDFFVGVAWAPGGRLLLDKLRGTVPAGVWTVGSSGTGLRRVLDGATSPSWAPDGRRFAVVLNGHVVIVSPVGTVLDTVGATGVDGVQWGGPSH